MAPWSTVLVIAAWACPTLRPASATLADAPCGENGGEGNSEWDENRFLLHEGENICVPMSNCQASGDF